VSPSSNTRKPFKFVRTKTNRSKHKNDRQNRCQWLKTFDHVIFLFFFMEMLIKMIAMGVSNGPQAYLSDHWNRLDCFIVIAGGLEYLLDIGNVNLTAIRTVRVLRPLRAINRIPSKWSSARSKTGATTPEQMRRLAQSSPHNRGLPLIPFPCRRRHDQRARDDDWSLDWMPATGRERPIITSRVTQSHNHNHSQRRKHRHKH